MPLFEHPNLALVQLFQLCLSLQTSTFLAPTASSSLLSPMPRLLHQCLSSNTHAFLALPLPATLAQLFHACLTSHTSAFLGTSISTPLPPFQLSSTRASEHPCFPWHTAFIHPWPWLLYSFPSLNISTFLVTFISNQLCSLYWTHTLLATPPPPSQTPTYHSCLRLSVCLRCVVPETLRHCRVTHGMPMIFPSAQQK